MVEKEIRSNVDKCKSKLMTLVTPFITPDNINGQGKGTSKSALPCWTAYGNESYVKNRWMLVSVFIEEVS